MKQQPERSTALTRGYPDAKMNARGAVQAAQDGERTPKIPPAIMARPGL